MVQANQHPIYDLYLTDAFGTVTDKKEADSVKSYAVAHASELEEELGLVDIPGIFERGEAARNSPEGKKHPDFITYISAYDQVTPLAYDGGMIMPAYEDTARGLSLLDDVGARVQVFSSSAASTIKKGFASAGLDRYIEQYHDGELGGKQDVASYQKIAELAGLDPALICYLTDDAREASAAAKAGYGKVFFLDRKGGAPVSKEYEVTTDYLAAVESTLKALPPEGKVEIEQQA